LVTTTLSVFKWIVCQRLLAKTVALLVLASADCLDSIEGLEP
jgi:hypothetical protein